MSNEKLQPMLWWIFDSESKQFTTLPTGPILAPALLLALILYVNKVLLCKTETCVEAAGELAKTSEWKTKYARYSELTDKRVATNNNLTLQELTELKSLKAYLYNRNS